VDGDRVFAFNPASGEALAVDGPSGKLLWERTLPGEGQSIAWDNGGMSLADGRLLAYGASAAVLDPASGEVVWAFDPSRAQRAFPLRLEAPRDASAATVGGPAPQRAVISLPGSAWVSPAQTPAYVQAYGYGGYQAVPTVSLVNYLATDAWTSWTGGAAPGAQTALAPPAVAWAAATRGSRLGCVTRGRMLLFDDAGFYVLTSDLPLAARRIEAGGAFVGLAGDRVCLVDQQALTAIDPATGRTLSYPLAGVKAGQPMGEVRVALDGHVAYLIGAAGIEAVNVRSGARLFDAPWPAAVAPPPPEPPQGGTQLTRLGTLAHAGAGGATLLPPVALAADGTLYAVWGSRVVALVERAADGR
jgi:hypothetical protein